MGRKRKTEKLEQANTFPNIFHNKDYSNPELTNNKQQVVDFKGKWKSGYFKNDNPLILELACGKGDYTLALARKHKNINYIGVDIKGPRLWKGAKTALEEEITNVCFVRTFIEYIENFFEEGEVDEIWITFPDPFSRKGDIKKRLSSHIFLPKYQQICKKGAFIHFKTDDLPLFHYTKESVEEHNLEIVEYIEDIYAQENISEYLEIKTYYEHKHIAKGRTINYLRFKV